MLKEQILLSSESVDRETDVWFILNSFTHRRDIENVRLDKAVPKHFYDTRSTAADLVFVPFKRIKAGDRHTLRHFENKAINDFNMIAAGVNRILA